MASDNKTLDTAGVMTGAAVGGVFGALFGGPLGAAIGAATGSWLGHQAWLRDQVKSLFKQSEDR